MSALRGIERTYGSVLAPRIAERLWDGKPARKNRTLLHGDLHIGNIIYAPQDSLEKSEPFKVRLIDFAQAGMGHPVFELLYFLQFYDEECIGNGAVAKVLGTYHSALLAANPFTCYT